jgi:hypothetical protein
VWFGDCSSIDWCGSNVGNCMGVEDICLKPKNLHLWLCSHVELCQVYLQNMYYDEDKKGSFIDFPKSHNFDDLHIVWWNNLVMVFKMFFFFFKA